MVSPRSSSVREEKENEVFFKKVKLVLVTCPHQSCLKRDVFIARSPGCAMTAVDVDSFHVEAGGLIQSCCMMDRSNDVTAALQAIVHLCQ